MLSGTSVKNIIFDLGGVILNINYSLTINAFIDLGIKNFNELYSQAQQAGLFNDYETGKTNENDFFDALDKKTGVSLKREDAVKAWNAMLLDLPPERIDLLRQLKNKYRLFLLSNTNETHIAAFTASLEKTFKGNPLEAIFEKIYYSCRCGCRKPDEEIFKSVMDENGLKPEETLFIDDSPQHIEAAQKLGLKTVYLEKPLTIMDVFASQAKGFGK